MNLKKKLRAGVIGLGVGAHQVRTLNSNANCDLLTICDFDKKKLYDIGNEFPHIKQTQNDNDILYDPKIDLVCIASYDEYHYQQVMIALEQNKHVYVEKPICLKRSEIINIHNLLIKKPNLKLSSNMVLRTCPLFNKVRQIVKNQEMGPLYYLEADYFWGRKYKLLSGWRSKTEFYSIIHGAAVHMIDLIFWITGKKPVSVNAIGSRIIAKGTTQKHNDFAVLLLECEDNLSIKITAHGGCVHPHFHSLKVFGKNKTFIHDTSGTFWIDSSDSNHEFRSENAAYPAKTHRKVSIESFINFILGFQTEPLVSKEDVFNVMNICFATELAMENGKKQLIKYL